MKKRNDDKVNTILKVKMGIFIVIFLVMLSMKYILGIKLGAFSPFIFFSFILGATTFGHLLRAKDKGVMREIGSTIVLFNVIEIASYMAIYSKSTLTFYTLFILTVFLMTNVEVKLINKLINVKKKDDSNSEFMKSSVFTDTLSEIDECRVAYSSIKYGEITHINDTLSRLEYSISNEPSNLSKLNFSLNSCVPAITTLLKNYNELALLPKTDETNEVIAATKESIKSFVEIINNEIEEITVNKAEKEREILEQLKENHTKSKLF